MKKNWKYKKIGEVCIVERGGSPRPIDKFITTDESGVNWVKIGDTTDSMFITKTKQKIKPEGMKKSRYVLPGDLLLSNSMSFGRPYIMKIDGCIHDGWLLIRDENGIFDKRFLYYYLGSPTTYRKFMQLAVGGVVNNLNSKMVRNVMIPVIPKEEQLKIVEVFDNVQSIIDKRKEELILLDNFIKSRFVEMFGDIFNGKSNYSTVKISEVVVLKIERSKMDFKDDDEIKYVDISSVDNKKNIIVGYTDYLMRDAPSRAQQHVRKGDIIISTVRPNLNNVAKIQHDYLNIVASSGFCVLRASKVESNFLFALVSMKSFADYLSSLTTGANYPAVSDKDILNFGIPNAPIDEQIIFSNLIEKVDKLKFTVQKSLDETQKLFDSLMQDYFE